MRGSKLHALLLLTVGLHLSLALNEDLKYALECGDKENFEIKNVRVLAIKNFENADNDFKCFMNCMLGKLEIYKDNEFKEAGYLKFYKNARASVAKKIFKGCKEDVDLEKINSKNMTECDMAFAFFKCNLEFRPVLRDLKQWKAGNVQII